MNNNIQHRSVLLLFLLLIVVSLKGQEKNLTQEEDDARIDRYEPQDRVGMWGLSLGGMATMF